MLQCSQCSLELLTAGDAQLLSNRIVTRLRALIILPTRDLVTQVRETFEVVGKGRGLKVAYFLAYRNIYLSNYIY
jgi:superfamily II DNA/RNA helicase